MLLVRWTCCSMVGVSINILTNVPNIALRRQSQKIPEDLRMFSRKRTNISNRPGLNKCSAAGNPGSSGKVSGWFPAAITRDRRVLTIRHTYVCALRDRCLCTMHVCMHVYRNVDMHAYTRTPIRRHRACLCVYVSVYVCIRVYRYVHMHIRVCVCV